MENTTNKKSLSPLTSGETTDPNTLNGAGRPTLSLCWSHPHIKSMVPFSRRSFPRGGKRFSSSGEDREIKWLYTLAAIFHSYTILSYLPLNKRRVGERAGGRKGGRKGGREGKQVGGKEEPVFLRSLFLCQDWNIPENTLISTLTSIPCIRK